MRNTPTPDPAGVHEEFFSSMVGLAQALQASADLVPESPTPLDTAEAVLRGAREFGALTPKGAASLLGAALSLAMTHAGLAPAQMAAHMADAADELVGDMDFKREGEE